jgi:hypothetical protein
LSHNSLYIGHSGMDLAGHGALWVNPGLFKLDPGLRNLKVIYDRGDNCNDNVPNVVTIV